MANMLRHTFVNLRAKGGQRLDYLQEKTLWEKEVNTFQTFRDEARRNKALIPFLADLDATERAISDGNLAFFKDRLPQKRDRWRLWEQFKSRATLLDIETTGLDRELHAITTIALADSRGNMAFVPSQTVQDARLATNAEGIEIRDFGDFLTRVSGEVLLVTFNGYRFDVPFLHIKLPEMREPTIHLDVMFNLRAFGLKGGQKPLEKRFGFNREAEIADVRGDEAVRLWQQYVECQDLDALRKLIVYNMTDTSNLRRLMDVAYALNCIARGFDAEFPEGFDMGIVAEALGGFGKVVW